MDQCKCIKVAREVVTYNNLQLLDGDLEFLKSNKAMLNGDKSYKLDVLQNLEMVEIQAFSRLSAAGILMHIREFTKQIGIGDWDNPFSNIKHIGHFLSNVKECFNLLCGYLV